MSSTFEIREKGGWFSETGKLNDAVISSRIRLSRNLNGHRYPGTMNSDDEGVVSGKIVDAFDSYENGGDFGVSEVGKISPLERKILMERNHLSQDYILHPEKTLIISRDNLSSCVINDTDHLRLSVFNAGLEIRTCYEKADRIDGYLESRLDYAVSFEFGYLNTQVDNLGTGLRASVMMHLPALVTTGLIEKALKAVVQLGFTVKGFMGEDDNSLGSMYQLSNQFTIGQSEDEIIEKLENLALQIADYERKARTELLEKKRSETEDKVFRAFGLLTNCRLLGSNEAISNLSILRMGVGMKMLDIPIEVCSALLFLSQKSHIQAMIKDKDASADENLINFTRARYVNEVLKDGKL